MSKSAMLPRDRSYTIGVISWTLADNYCGLVVLGIHDVLARAGGRLLIFQGLPDDVRTATAHVDGWITIIKTDGIETILRHGKPCVTVAGVVEGAGTTAILADNQGGAVTALEHLIAHGHRRIAFVGCRTSSDIQQRYASYCAVLAAHGIAYDPALVYEASDDLVWGGRVAGERLVEAGLPCSAVFVATDENALGLMSVVQAAGHRVPEDLAVVGFDNIMRAQQTNPPLTTVSQRPEVLGQTAARQLLEMLAGAAAPPVVQVPTSLVVRGSCGCSASSRRQPEEQRPPEVAGRVWQAALAEELARLALAPTLADAPDDLGASWPGVELLVAGLQATARAEEPPPQVALSDAWDQLLFLAFDESVLERVIERMGQAALDHLGVERDGAGWQRVQAYLALARARYAQLWLSWALRRVDFLSSQVQSNFEVSLQLLGAEVGSATDLAWLSRWPEVKWAYLALWPEHDGPDPLNLTIAGAYNSTGGTAGVVGRRCRAASFPASAGAPDCGDHAVLVLPITRSGRSPVENTSASLQLKNRAGALALCVPRDHNIASDKLLMWSMLLSSALEREELLRSLARARAAAENSSRLKTEFLSTMTHELRTPLNAVLNFTRFMDNPAIGGTLNEQQRHFQERVLVNSARLLQLINHIMDLTAFEENSMELDREPIELSPLLEQALASGLSLAQEQGLEVHIRLPDAMLPTLDIDPVRVKQVLENLLSNAVKFTHAGSITISVETLDEREICLAVHDTGIGIPADKHHLVFESYRQIDGGLTRAYGGTGLGLALSKRFVELHGGRLWFESQPGQGTTFFFTLPILQPHLEQSEAAEHRPLSAV